MFQVESLHYKSSLTDVKMVYVLLWVWTQAYMCSPLSVKGERRGGGGGRLQVSLSPVKKISRNGKYSMFNNIIETEFPSCPYRRKFMELHMLWHFT